jgi:PAS domain S-box-containing protein
MARDGYTSAPTLSAAHSGRTFPTWHATQAYLRGCGVSDLDSAAWLSRWCQIADAIGYRGPRPAGAGAGLRGAAPDCRAITTIADFRAAVRQLFRWTAATSQADFVREAERRGLTVAKATLSDMLMPGRDESLPSAASLRMFLDAAGLSPDDVQRWMAMRDSLARSRRGRPEARDAGAQLHDHFDNAPCGLLTTLPDGTITEVNRTFLELTAYARAGLVGVRRFRDLLSAGGKIYHEAHYCALLRLEGAVHEVAFEIVCADGRRLPVLVNSVLTRDDAGQPKLIRTTVFDVSSRLTYERELLAARRAAEEEVRRLRAQQLPGVNQQAPGRG